MILALDAADLPFVSMADSGEDIDHRAKTSKGVMRHSARLTKYLIRYRFPPFLDPRRSFEKMDSQGVEIDLNRVYAEPIKPAFEAAGRELAVPAKV